MKMTATTRTKPFWFAFGLLCLLIVCAILLSIVYFEQKSRVVLKLKMMINTDQEFYQFNKERAITEISYRNYDEAASARYSDFRNASLKLDSILHFLETAYIEKTMASFWKDANPAPVTLTNPSIEIPVQQIKLLWAVLQDFQSSFEKICADPYIVFEKYGTQTETDTVIVNFRPVLQKLTRINEMTVHEGVMEWNNQRVKLHKIAPVDLSTAIIQIRWLTLEASHNYITAMDEARKIAFYKRNFNIRY